MSWYLTKEEAEEACKWKEIEYKEPFVPLEEKNPRISNLTSIWWAQRKSALND